MWKTRFEPFKTVSCFFHLTKKRWISEQSIKHTDPDPHDTLKHAKLKLYFISERSRYVPSTSFLKCFTLAALWTEDQWLPATPSQSAFLTKRSKMTPTTAQEHNHTQILQNRQNMSSRSFGQTFSLLVSQILFYLQTRRSNREGRIYFHSVFIEVAESNTDCSPVIILKPGNTSSS